MDITENSDQQNEQEQLSPYDAFYQKIENTWEEYKSGKTSLEQRTKEIEKLLDELKIENSKLYDQITTEDDNGKTEMHRITEKMVHKFKFKR